MITIHKFSAAADLSYLGDPVRGRWAGTTAVAESLLGAVDATGLRALFAAGHHPLTGAALGTPLGARPNVTAGYDVVLIVPEAAAVLWAASSPADRAVIEDTHRRASDRALGRLEGAAYTRTGINGIAYEKAPGLMAAVYDHGPDTANGAGLHSHVLVSARVRRGRSGWGALDGQALADAAESVGEGYLTDIVIGVRERLGVRIPT